MISNIYGVYKYIREFLVSVIRSDAKNSLLTYPQSDAIKGVLIMLIVLGHNKYLMQGGLSNIYLYSFHVYAFYYLPFLYDFKNVIFFKSCRINLKRLYVPYTVIFLLLTLIAVLQGKTISPCQGIMTYICGSQFLLGEIFGFGSFLWFVPTMFSVLIFRWIYYHLKFNARCVMLILSAICLVGFTYRLSFSVFCKNYAPFCMTVAMAMIFPAVILRELFKRMNKSVTSLLFFVLMIAIMVVYPMKNEYGMLYLTINRLACPILIFSLLLSIRELLEKSNFLIIFGKQSFKIYLIHIFVYNAIYLALDKYAPGLYIGLVAYISCFAIAYLISSVPILKYIFPR